MKAKVIKQNYEFTLSIGMIIKNEEKHLDRCLSAIKPLLENISSELVIIDTGSTDQSLQIASKYTDKIFHFDWISDFSAARNFGLEKCKGEWFMYLDADDIFDPDLNEMIDFFNNKSLNKNYNSATYQTKNYSDIELKNWTMQTQYRIVRRQQGVKFIHPIHEIFNNFVSPTFSFNTFSEHFGYIYENDEQKINKQLRNLNLLKKQYQQNPENLNIMLMLFRDLEDKEEKNQFVWKIVEIIKMKKDSNGGESALLEISRYYYNLEDYDAVIKYTGEYFSLFKDRSVVALDMYVIRAGAFANSGQAEEAKDCYSSYLRIFKLFRFGKLKTTALKYVTLSFTEEAHHDGIKGLYENLIKQ